MASTVENPFFCSVCELERADSQRLLILDFDVISDFSEDQDYFLLALGVFGYEVVDAAEGDSLFVVKLLFEPVEDGFNEPGLNPSIKEFVEL